MLLRHWLTTLWLISHAGHSFGASVPSIQKTKLCDPTTETRCAAVDASSRLSVYSTQNGAWTTGRTWTLSNGTDSIAAVQSGTWSTGRTWTLANGTDSVAAVQSGAWTTGRTWTLSNGTDSIAAIQSGTWNITNISGTISLPTGASTATLQSTGNASLASIDGKLNSLGQKTMANSAPVVIASDQSPIPASQSGTWTSGRTWSLLNSTDSVNAVQSGTWSAGRTWTLGAGTDAATVTQGPAAATSGAWPIKITDGTSVSAVKAASTAPTAADPAVVVALSPNGAQATAALQTSGNSSLSSIDTKTPTIGQKTMANSSPVVIASDQSAIPASQSGTWTAGRTWSLLNSTDSVNAVQSGAWTTGRTWSLASGTDSIASVQSGSWTTGRTWTLAAGTDAETVTQGPAAVTSGAWPIKVSDGTSVTAVKAASTAPAAADPALVVALSPNGAQATSALQTSGNASLSSIDSKITGVATAANQSTEITSVQILDDVPTAMNGAFVKGAPAMGQLDDTSTTAATEDNLAPVRITAQRAAHANLRDTSGNAIGVAGNPLITGNALSTSNSAIAFGDVTTSATTTTIVRRTAYTEPGAAAAFSIKSSSASDAAAGTGARTIVITYADASVTALNTETVTLNGTTCVNSVTTNAKFFEEIAVATVGSTGSNVGIVTLYTGTGCTTVVGTVAATDNEVFWAHHYVPTGKICNITGLSVSHNGTTVGSGAVFLIRATQLGVSGAVDDQVGDSHRLYGQSSTVARTYASPVRVSGPARVSVFVTPETASSTVYRASIDFFEP